MVCVGQIIRVQGYIKGFGYTAVYGRKWFEAIATEFNWEKREENQDTFDCILSYLYYTKYIEINMCHFDLQKHVSPKIGWEKNYFFMYRFHKKFSATLEIIAWND